MGAAPNMMIPPATPDGRRATPNRNLSAQASLWHMRMALNVAALSCRDGADAVRLQYNQFLKLHKATLAKANSAVDSEYKSRYGAAAIMQRENLNTTVYNFFALPPAQKAFCTQAIAVGNMVNTLTPATLLTYAPTGLASLEKPFTDFYDAYAVYKVRLAEWRSATGGQQLSRPSIMAPPPAPLPTDLSQADVTRGDDVIAPRGPLLRMLAAR